MIKNIALIGMMGSGKSSVASILANVLNRPLIECDLIIEQNEKLLISDIFSHYGEEYFRNRESELCIELAQKEGSIISCGGGIILHTNNCINLRKSSWIVFIDRKIENILETIDREHRPLAQNQDQFLKIYHQRLPIYKESAHFTIQNNGSFEDIIDQILSSIPDSRVEE